jgi:hypothetical protein
LQGVQRGPGAGGFHHQLAAQSLRQPQICGEAHIGLAALDQAQARAGDAGGGGSWACVRLLASRWASGAAAALSMFSKRYMMAILSAFSIV